MPSTTSDWIFGGYGPASCPPAGLGLVWIHAFSDAVMALALASIFMALAIAARRRRDKFFAPRLSILAAFVLVCAIGEGLNLSGQSAPAYGFRAAVAATAAMLSVAAAFALWQILSRLLALPPLMQLKRADAALRESEERASHLQRLETIGRLAGGVAHDFNNIIQVWESGLTLIERRLRQGRSADIQEYVPALRQAAANASALTGRLLAFSRRGPPRTAAIDPDELLAGMEELVRRTLGVFVDLRIEPRDGRWNVVCDAHQLESVILNLAVNARDAMPRGGLLTIATFDRLLAPKDVVDREGAAPGKYVEFAVEDTGEGMTPDTLARAFEPFFTTKPSGKGTGLGLSQVADFARQSGGFVRIASKPGVGTTVRLFLPAESRSEKGEERLAPAPLAAELPRARGRILVVEDQDQVRVQLVEALSETGCDVVGKKDGLEALRFVAASGPVDLLVTDFGLPGLNGRQLADIVRVTKPKLPVLLITGHTNESVSDSEFPPDIEILRKPFSLADFAGRVCALVSSEGPEPRAEPAARGG